MKKRERHAKLSEMHEKARKKCDEEFKDPKLAAQCRYGVDQLERTIRTTLAPRPKKG